jgi:hypothetical protein
MVLESLQKHRIKLGEKNMKELNKAVEVAMVCAAQDGLDRDEMAAACSSITSVPMLTSAFAEMLEEDEIDVLEAMETIIEGLEGFESWELTELNQAYMDEASIVLGDRPSINNICLALCMVICSGDQEVSHEEENALNMVAQNLSNLNQDLVNAAAQMLLSGIDGLE